MGGGRGAASGSGSPSPEEDIHCLCSSSRVVIYLFSIFKALNVFLVKSVIFYFLLRRRLATSLKKYRKRPIYRSSYCPIYDDILYLSYCGKVHIYPSLLFIFLLLSLLFFLLQFLLLLLSLLIIIQIIPFSTQQCSHQPLLPPPSGLRWCIT